MGVGGLGGSEGVVNPMRDKKRRRINRGGGGETGHGPPRKLALTGGWECNEKQANKQNDSIQ